MTAPRIPVTLVTGFLGAGKSTLISRVLDDVSPRRIAVVENELAEVGVDQRLLAGRAGGIVALSGGCVCCSARGDLLGAVRSVCSVGCPPDAILIETSGIARPSATAADLVELGAAERQIWLRAIIVVVDATNAATDSARAEFVDQVVHADAVILAKHDLADGSQRRDARRVIRAINPTASIVLAADAGAGEVLGPFGDQSESAFAPVPGVYALGHDIDAVCVAVPGDLDGPRLRTLLDELARDPSVLRVKGFVTVDGGVRLVQGVHATVDTLPWSTIDPDGLALVVIGERLDERQLRGRLDEVRASS